MESLLYQQEDLLDRLENAFSNYRKTPRERLTQSYIEARIDNLEKMCIRFNENHYSIVGSIKKSERAKLTYFEENYCNKFENIYTEYKTKMKDELLKFTQRGVMPSFSGASSTQAVCDVRLPQIHLPNFSGGYEEWQEFYDMFTSVIHTNTNLNAVQKLHYLKGSLSGEAANLLKNLPTTDDNYEEAWNQLKRRYTNKRYTCNEIMKRLFSQKVIPNESAPAIKSLLDTTSACLKSLSNIGVDTQSWDAIINYMTLSKLDIESRKLWEIQLSQLSDNGIPKWDQLYTFMETRFRTLEMLEGGSKSIVRNTSIKPLVKQKSFHSKIEKNNSQNIACTMCSESHLLYQCKQFGSQSPEERSEFVQSKRLCFNCLAPNHTVKFCRQSTCCRRCGRRHHSLLHLEYKDVSTARESNEQAKSENEINVSSHFAHDIINQSEVLLATAVVKIISNTGCILIVRVLIDQGSEASFINEATVQALGLKRTPVNGIVSGVGDGQSRTQSMVTFTLQSRYNSYSKPINAYVLSTLTSLLPNRTTAITDWPEIEKLSLADPEYGVSRKVDVILGVDVLSDIILEGLKKHPSKGGPIAQNTQLGWMLSGSIQSNINHSNTRIISLHLQVKEDQLLTKFWEIERGPEGLEKKRTKEEKRCEEFFEKTTTRNSEGRYIVRLPFKEEYPQCFEGETEKKALQRFKALERRLRKDDKLYDDYKNVIKDYIVQGHMVKVSEPVRNHKSFYLPHHAVVREDKETTKVRCVFDASCKGSNKVSLNDCLLVGPKLQQDLRHILMRWRLYPFCLVADIVQMYRQILVHDDDTDCQRIWWRFNPTDPIECYKLVRLTFGTSCAPYLAVKCLQQLAIDEQSKYPSAARITLQDFYMDDLLSGGETELEVIEIYKELNQLMETGGFSLQKWCTNSQELLNHIKFNIQRSDQSLIFKENDMIKVLGICWNKNSDSFEYMHQLPKTVTPITKRKVLSEIARLYDPLGWIAPVIITAKIYMQKLWKSGLSWDDEITPDLLKEWIRFKRDLVNVQDIIIPRWLQVTRNDFVELHAFADASQSAYAAAIYIKVKDAVGCIKVHLVTAKTRVAPVEKEISIPRLELCAALLASQLLSEVSQVLNIPKNNIHAWSDSTVTLAWLRGEPSRWTTFVSNRVSEILTIMDRDQWNHVSSKDNPADCASRGIPASEVINHKLWWHGPEWLKHIHCYQSTDLMKFVTTEEQRSTVTAAHIAHIKEDGSWTRFSTLQRMLRVLSYCRRVLQWKKPKKERELSKNITPKEMDHILLNLVKECQRLYFKDEINQLRAKGSVVKSSKLTTLCPILDKNNVLRVGGRIHQSQESVEKKHPLILPSDSHLTKLIIQYSHEKTFHGGPQLMLNFLRTKYWIIRARDLVKKCYRNCVTCVRYSQYNHNQLMGQLPEARLKPARPFKVSGVDFTGHINIRFSPGRGSKSYKGYICLFVCLVTKAIHLEAVSDLTSQGFIAAYRRFVSRRGHCHILYSDNGTNFIGADKELREMFNRATSQLPDEIGHLLANEGTEWKFIPPQAPNFGGLWEAAVRSTKKHLKRVIGDATLTFEELTTVLTQIEACLNSRPLSYLSEHPDDPLPLTPGHFLVGESLLTIPDETFTEEDNISDLRRWKYCQKLMNDFWRRWSDEYLVTLNQRYKWTTEKKEPEINDIVIIKDKNVPPAKWWLGRIVEKHSGRDNLTRVVSIKTKNGICKRPCNKLCFLPKASE